MQNHQFSIDTVVGLRAQLRSLQNQLNAINNKRVVSLPYSPSDGLPPEAVHGQVFFDENNDEWLFGVDDAWHRTTSGSSAYVFLQEIVVESDGDQIEFTDIDQSYRHIVLEMMLANAGAIGPSDIILAWNSFSSFDWNMLYDGSSHTPTGLSGGDDFGVTMKNFAPRFPGGDSIFSLITVKFPYYSVGSTVKGCNWQGVTINDEDENLVIATGGGFSVYHLGEDESNSDPVTSIKLTSESIYSASRRWLAGSKISLYGII